MQILFLFLWQVILIMELSLLMLSISKWAVTLAMMTQLMILLGGQTTALQF